MNKSQVLKRANAVFIIVFGGIILGSFSDVEHYLPSYQQLVDRNNITLHQHAAPKTMNDAIEMITTHVGR